MAFFELTTADLFKKAEADFTVMKESAGDLKLAFNFFVTVEHIPDWLKRRGEVRSQMVRSISRSTTSLGQMASECHQDSPIENPACDPGPASVLVSDKSSDQQEDQPCRPPFESSLISAAQSTKA